MAGPWDKYKQATKGDGQGKPWSKFSSETAAASAQYLNERQKDISWADRAAIKNFGLGAEKGAEYLRQKYPGLEVENVNGEIYARGKGEKDFRALDPSGIKLSDIGEDITDVGYDIASGAVTGLATAAGGAAGFLGGGLGALPAAAASGAGTSAGLELLRQKLGQAMGVAGDTDYGQVAFAGGAGALSPLLLGTGATAGQVAKGQLAKTLAGGADEAMLSQRGLLARGAGLFGNALKKTAATFSGVDESALDTFSKRYKDVLALEADPEGLLKRNLNLASESAGKVQRLKDSLWDTYEKSLASSKKVFDTTDIADMLKPIDDEIAKIARVGGDTPEALARVQELQGLKTIFHETTDLIDDAGNPITQLKTSLTPEQAEFMSAQLADLAGLSTVKEGTRQVAQTGNVQSKLLKKTAGKIRSQLRNKIKESIDDSGREAYEEWAQLARLSKNVLKKIDDPEKAAKTLRNLGKPTNEVLRQKIAQFDKMTGSNISDEARLQQAYNVFTPQQKFALSGSGQSGTQRKGLAVTAGTGLGAALGSLMGGAPGAYIGGGLGFAAGNAISSPTALRNYILTGAKLQNLNQALNRRVPYAQMAKVGFAGQMLQPEFDSPYNRMK